MRTVVARSRAEPVGGDELAAVADLLRELAVALDDLLVAVGERFSFE
jgi:hypothetical protein